MAGDPPVLRVLFVNENLGGHATLHRHVKAVLHDRADVEASFIDLPPASLVQEVWAARIPGLSRLDLDLKPLRFQLAQSAAVELRLRRWRRPFDVVHVYTQNAALLSARRFRRTPAVVSLDAPNSESMSRLPYRQPTAATPFVLRLSKLLEQPLFDAARFIVAQSEWAADAVRRDYRVDPGKVKVIRFGIIPAERSLSPEPSAGLLPEITFVGRSMERKGGWRLLRVFRAALRDRCLLNLVTPEAVRPEPGVRVYRNVQTGDSQLAAILARTAVFVLPSDMDISPYSVLEAMAAGVPVVTYAAAGMPELVESQVSGLLVPPRDDAALARAIVGLLEDEPGRQRMGRAAMLRVERQFDARITTAQLLDVLRDAAGIS
jgi:glycosyltransferase involved in cell wall biosynthesis